MLATRTAGPGHRALGCRCRFRRGAPGAGGRARRHPAPRLPGVGGSCRPGGTACLGLGLSATQEPSAGGSAAPEPRGAPRAGSAPSRCHAPLAPDAFSRRFRSLPPHSTRRRGCPSPGERPSRGGGRRRDGRLTALPCRCPGCPPPPSRPRRTPRSRAPARRRCGSPSSATCAATAPTCPCTPPPGPTAPDPRRRQVRRQRRSRRAAPSRSRKAAPGGGGGGGSECSPDGGGPGGWDLGVQPPRGRGGGGVSVCSPDGGRERRRVPGGPAAVC